MNVSRWFWTVTLWLAVVIGCVCTPVQAERDISEKDSARTIDRPSSTAVLKVLAWNIYMMPVWTFQSPQNVVRAEAIATELLKLDFDILCLEKAFDSHAVNLLARRLATRYPYQYGPANSSWSSLRINSGVWVLSRFRLTDYHEIEFHDWAGIEYFSKKGAMLLSGTVDHQVFQILATHLEGEEGPQLTTEHQAIRNKQIVQIRDDLIGPYAISGVPIFIAGDFGTPHRKENSPSVDGDDYRLMIKNLNATNGPGDRITLDDNKAHNDMATDNSGRLDELDYILVRSNGAPVFLSWKRLVIRHPGWNHQNRDQQDLSYKYAVGVTATFPSGTLLAPARR